MRSVSSFALSYALLGCFLFVAETYACSCSRPKACEYAARSDAVFIGEVTDFTETVKKEDLGGGTFYDMRLQISTVSVKEVFAGVGETKEVKVVTDISTSCAFPLSKGVTYLFYASGPGTDGNLVTGFCSGTKSIQAAENEVEELRRNQGQSTTVSGWVSIEGYSGLAGQSPFKHGVRTVRLVNGSGIAETGIDEQGQYKFTGVPAGEYTFEFPLPGFLRTKNWLNNRSPPGKEEPVRIKVSGIGCVEQTFSFLQNAKLSGVVTDTEGRPVTGITVYLVPLSSGGQFIYKSEYYSCYYYGHCQTTDEDGRYFFDGIEAEHYFVGVRLDKRICSDCIDLKFAAAYYPGVAEVSKAKKVTVTLGKPVENVNFKLTKAYVERVIVGTVTFPDGRPAPNVSVRYVLRSPDRKENWPSSVRTDETGRFSIKGYEGYDYLIGAGTDERDGNPPLRSVSTEVSVLPRKAIKAIKLTLSPYDSNNCDGCSDWDEFPKRAAKRKR